MTGVVHPGRILRNNTCQVGDQIILTKPLGVGMVTVAYRLGEASTESYVQAVGHMQTLNKYAMEAARPFRLHACTDVTGFGFLGHLNEMVTPEYSIRVTADRVPFLPEARRLAEAFLVTAGGLKNRKFAGGKVEFRNIDTATEEIFFDPQTSGGLLMSVHPRDAEAVLAALDGAAIVGEVVARGAWDVIVE